MEKIEGLSIGLDLETLRVERGLTGLKDKIRNVNSEMKANMSSFDRSDKSIGKYETRLDGLNKKLEVQKSVVKEAKSEYEKMVREHGEGSKQAEKAAREYNNQAASLNNLERYIQRTKNELTNLKKEQAIANSGWTKAGKGLKDFGSKLKGIGTQMSDIGGQLTKKITMPALGAVSALTGIALVKGFDRLIGIDTAQAKLKGLGHDAEGVEKIMESALDAVRGTSFGMGEAATTAANAVAAGVEPGKELTKYLSTTGDAAAIAGSSMSEMGAVLNKVKTSNKAYNGELQQLSDRGLPVYQWLAKEAGVAAEEVTNLASDGKISSEMLMKAIENNIGGAAQKIGEESFTAGWANWWAAVGRLGASFLDAGGKGGGFFSQLKPLIVDFTERVDTMGDFAEKAGVKFGEFFTGVIDKAKALKASYDGLSPFLQDIIKKLLLFGSVGVVALGPIILGLGKLILFVGGVTEAFGKLLGFIGKKDGIRKVGKDAADSAKKGGLLSKLFRGLLTGLRFLTGPIGWIITGVLALGTAFVTAYKKSEKFRNLIQSIGTFFKDLGITIYEFLKPAIDKVVEVFTGIYDSTKDILQNKVIPFIKNTFESVSEIVGNALSKVTEVISNVWGNLTEFVAPYIKSFTDFIKNAWSSLTSWFGSSSGKMLNKAIGIFGKIKDGISEGISTAVGFVEKIWSGLINWWNKNGDSILAKAKSIFNGVKDNVSVAISAVVDYVKSVWSNLTDFWNEHGDMIQQAAKNVWGFIKTVVLGTVTVVWNGIKKFSTGIYTAIKWALDKISIGWNVVWPKISKVALGAINGLSAGVKIVFPYIQKIIKTSMSVIEKIMTVVWPVVKFIVIETWNAIKGTIDGALKVITGIIQFFSALFTGNWSEMWDAVKNILSGAVKFIWNFIQLSFFGRIIKGGMLFIKGFAGLFKSMWTGISNLFSTVITWIVGFVRSSFTTMSNTVSTITQTIWRIITTIWNGIWSFFGKIINTIVNFVKNSFTGMWNIIKSIFNGIKDFITSLWNNVFSFFKNVIKGIVDFVKNRFTGMKDSTSNIFTTIRDTAQRLWNAVKDKIWNPVKNIVSNVKERFTSLKDGISETFKNIRDNVSGWIKEMVQNVKDMPGKMADGISKTIGKVKTAFGNIGNAMISTLQKGVNGVIGGINWVLEKLGIDYQVETWKSKAAFGGVAASVVGYAHGTEGHPKDGPAFVGDGIGRNAGPELVAEPGKKPYLSPSKPTLIPNMPKGTRVLSALDTKALFNNLPAYANGIGFNDIISSSRDMMRSINLFSRDAAFDVYSYIDDPKKLLDKALAHLGVKASPFIGALKQVPIAGFNKVKDGGVKFLKKKIDNMFSSGTGVGMGAGISNVGGWALPIRRAAAQMREKVTNAEVQGILAQIQRESGGNQRIVQSSAVWDVNMANNNPAKGLLQYIPQTFNAYKVKGFGNIFDGYHQLLAFFNNRTWRRDLPYGKRGWGPRGGRKYKQGTNYVPEDGPAYLHKGEAVIPAAYNQPARRTEAMKLLALAGKRIVESNKSHQTSNASIGGNSAGIEYLERMVALLSQQVDDLKQVILLLTQLVAKNPNIQIGEHEFKTFVSDLTDKGLNEIGNKKKNAWGGA